MRNQLNEISETIEEEIRREFNSDREQLRRQAPQSISNTQEENKRNYNSERKEAKQYQVGDLVAISKTQFSTGAKLKPKNLGPYKITRAKGNERYDVERVGKHDGRKQAHPPIT